MKPTQRYLTLGDYCTVITSSTLGGGYSVYSSSYRNFLSGFSSVFDVFPERRITLGTLSTDVRTVTQDWYVIGRDFANAIDRHASEHDQQRSEASDYRKFAQP